MFLPQRRAFHVTAMSSDNDHFQGNSADKSTAAIKGFHSPLELCGATVYFYTDRYTDAAALAGGFGSLRSVIREAKLYASLLYLMCMGHYRCTNRYILR